MKHICGKKAVSVFLSLVLLVSALCLVSCHGSSSLTAFDVPDTFNMASNYEITFWAKNDTNVTQTKVYSKAVEDFQKLYPNIHVNLRFYTTSPLT